MPVRPGPEVTGDLTAHQREFAARADLFVQGVVQTLTNEIVSGGRYSPGTPIDTGFARANWYGGIGAEGTPPTVAPPVARRAGERAAEARAAAGQVEQVAQQARAGDVVVLANNAPYIGRLEEGHSRQAPAGMIRLALMHMPEITREVAAHVFAR